MVSREGNYSARCSDKHRKKFFATILPHMGLFFLDLF
nr:MAG TPA: hypothetical protein [Caudoviricetes sp.]